MSHSVAQPIREVSTTKKKSFPAVFVTSTAWDQKKETGLPSQEHKREEDCNSAGLAS